MNVFIINSADTYEHRVDLLYNFFKKQGNHVTVLASDFRHIAKERRMEPKEGYKFFTAEPYYRNLSMQRIMSYKHLSEDIFRYVGEHIQEVDLLWVLVPPNSFVKDAAKIKKQYPRIQLVLDIIDMWPETLPVGNLKDCYPIKFWGRLRDEYIKLGQALKATGIADSGIDAKEIIIQGLVLVDGEVETRRGRKLYDGMEVCYDDEVISIQK